MAVGGFLWPAYKKVGGMMPHNNAGSAIELFNL
jgi:hypothetical protein